MGGGNRQDLSLTWNQGVKGSLGLLLLKGEKLLQKELRH